MYPCVYLCRAGLLRAVDRGAVKKTQDTEHKMKGGTNGGAEVEDQSEGRRGKLREGREGVQTGPGSRRG